MQNLQAQYGNRTAILNLDREPRFYSSLAFDRGYNRTWGSFWNLRMRKGEIHGRIANSNDYLITGYALKKLVHPDSEGDGYSKIVTYSWPMIRFAEVYLNYAEALNEINGPSQEAYNALNFIRDRAGIKSIEEAWGDSSIALTLDKHTTQDGLREIIHQERLIELSLEVIIIGKNKPNAYKRIITIEAIINALIALIFIEVIFHQFSYLTNAILTHV